MKILLIDDESFVLKLFARQLANLGFTEVTCMSVLTRHRLSFLRTTHGLLNWRGRLKESSRRIFMTCSLVYCEDCHFKGSGCLTKTMAEDG